MFSSCSSRASSLFLKGPHVDFDVFEPVEIGLHPRFDFGDLFVVDLDLDVLEHRDLRLHLDLEILDACELGLDPLFCFLHFGQDLLEFGAGLAGGRVAGVDGCQGGDHGRHQNRRRDDDRHADAAVGGFLQDCHDAFLQVGRAGHPQGGNGGCGGWQGVARDSQQVAGVVRRSGTESEDFFVAGQFLLEIEAANRPPREGVEPVGRTGDPRDHPRRPVEAGDVDQFVQEHRLAAVVEPGCGAQRQQNGRPEDADGGRDLDLVGDQEANLAPAGQPLAGRGRGAGASGGRSPGAPAGLRLTPATDRSRGEHQQDAAPRAQMASTQVCHGNGVFCCVGVVEIKFEVLTAVNWC